MKPFPIQTERLVLREFLPEDEAAIHEYASDPEVTKSTAWGPNDLATTKAVLDEWLEQQDKWPRESVPLAVELKGEGKVIGNTGFSAQRPLGPGLCRRGDRSTAGVRIRNACAASHRGRVLQRS